MTTRIIAVDISQAPFIDSLSKSWAEIPQGEWDDEPQAARIICGDTPCVALRNHLYTWCGYVGVPVGEALYGKDYCDHYEDWPDIHGGWTFSDKHPAADYVAGLSGLWWIGFDCAHAGDISPGMLRFSTGPSFGFERDEYRTLEYVAGELCRAAAQLNLTK